jgi:hypothetical protein
MMHLLPPSVLLGKLKQPSLSSLYSLDDFTATVRAPVRGCSSYE